MKICLGVENLARGLVQRHRLTYIIGSIWTRSEILPGLFLALKRRGLQATEGETQMFTSGEVVSWDCTSLVCDGRDGFHSRLQEKKKDAGKSGRCW